jgi:hypothetical protein
VISGVLLGWVIQSLNIGFGIPSHPVKESLGVHDAGPYYVFTSSIHTRHDMRVLEAEAVPKETDVVSTRSTYPKIRR